MSSKKVMKTPDTYIIIFLVVILAAISRLFVPVGSFETKKVTYEVNGQEKSRTVVRPETFTLLKDGGKKNVTKSIALFEPYGKVGVFNYLFEGFTSGSKWGTSIGIIAFILIVGGSFGIILRTRAIECGIFKVISRLKGHESFFIPVLFVLFSLLGALFGMSEEALPFVMIIVPLMVAIGYDAVTGVLVTYGATQIGFATSWMNPFSVAIAQGIAGVPLLSGSGFRFFMWIFFTTLGVLFTSFYAFKIKKNPKKSLSYESDAYFRDHFNEKELSLTPFGVGHACVLLIFFLGILWVAWGVMAREYYIPSITTQFFIIGISCGIVGALFQLNSMSFNDIPDAFRQGVKDLVGAAMCVAMAKGIIIVLGGDSPTEPNVLNTALHYAGEAIGSFPRFISAWFMYVLQCVINFFVVSGSGQASLTMPIMAPLSDIVGVSKQIAVLAFQLGDGFTNLIVPTSACLMGALGIARIDWGVWFKWLIGVQVVLFFLSSIFIYFAVLINY